MTSQTYQQASQRFLAEAKQELAAGDLQQASEKGWGATAQMLEGHRRAARLGTRQAPASIPRRQPTPSRNGRPRRLPLFLSGQRPARKLLRKRDVGRGHRRELGRYAGFARQARDAAETGLTTSRARPRLCEPHPAVGSFPAQRHRSHQGLAKGLSMAPAQELRASPCICHRLR